MKVRQCAGAFVALFFLIGVLVMTLYKTAEQSVKAERIQREHAEAELKALRQIADDMRFMREKLTPSHEAELEGAFK